MRLNAAIDGKIFLILSFKLGENYGNLQQETASDEGSEPAAEDGSDAPGETSPSAADNVQSGGDGGGEDEDRKTSE